MSFHDTKVVNFYSAKAKRCSIMDDTAHDSLRRPRSLVDAARAGQAGWRRERDLRKALRCDTLPEHGPAIRALREIERRQNDARLARHLDYDIHRHVLVMIAILAETRAQRARKVDHKYRACPPARPDRQIAMPGSWPGSAP